MAPLPDAGTGASGASGTTSGGEGEDALPDGIRVPAFAALSRMRGGTRDTVERVFRTYRDLEMVLRDVTGDDVPEMVYQRRVPMRTVRPVVAIFSGTADKMKRILWNGDTVSEEVGAGSAGDYIPTQQGLIYQRTNDWLIGEYIYAPVSFDEDKKESYDEIYLMHMVEDFDAYERGVHDLIRAQFPHITGRGVWYYILRGDETPGEANLVSEEVFTERFTERFGMTPASFDTRTETTRQRLLQQTETP